MPYLLLEDFRHGMDRRRQRVAGALGTLWLGKNIHITNGGDIERRLKFVPVYTVAGTFGATALQGQLYVFGSVASGSLSIPVGVQYQRLQHPSTGAMTKLLDVKTFAGQFYAIAEFDDGNVYHYYNGSRVTTWDTVAATTASFALLAELLASKIENDAAVTAVSLGNTVVITALVAGTSFTIATTAANGGGVNDQTAAVTHTQANVAEVEEVRASATITVSGGTNDPGVNQIAAVTINGVSVLGNAVDWSGSNDSTAVRLASEIASGYATHGYTASASGSTVTVTAAPGTGTTPNGYDFIATAAGNVSLSTSTTMSGGVAAVEAVAQVETVTLAGTFEVADTFTITIDGTDYKATGRAAGTGRSAVIQQHRVWSPVSSLWRYCKLDDATEWNPAAVGSDAGAINVSQDTDGAERLSVGARYQGLGATFSANNITLYQLDTNPANFAFQQTLENTGTKSPAAVTRYGNNDVFYLDITGVRSLRERESSATPFVSDVGNAIDTYVQELIETLSDQEVADAVGAIEPKGGRYWLSLGDEILVLSLFPSAGVKAWSVYEPTEFEGEAVQAMVRTKGRLVVRAGDYLYFYGGLTGDTQPDDDEVTAEVEFPFLSGRTQATIKYLTGFDVALVNTWACELAFDPNDADRTMNIGNLRRITFADSNRIPLPGETSMFAPKLTCSKGGAASISMIAIHYESEDAPG